MESEDDFQKKQTLLQNEIIEKNYDKTAFINFCLSKKENGDDLGNWTLEELNQVVKDFIKSQNPEPSQKDQNQLIKVKKKLKLKI